MKEVLVGEALSLTCISKTNHNAWENLIKIAILNPDEEVVFDFKGVTLNYVYHNPKFKEFLSLPNVKLRVYFDETVRATLEMECLLGGFSKEKILFVEKVVPVEVDPNVLKTEKMAKSIIDDIKVEGDTLVFETYKRFMSGIRGYDTFNGLKLALTHKLKETNLDKVILDFGDTATEGDITVRLSELIREAMNGGLIRGVEVFIMVKSSKLEMMETIGLLNCIVNQGVMTEEEKLEYIEEHIPVGMVGLITKYKEGRVKSDRFGRSGNGEAVYRRVAIYRGNTKLTCGNNTEVKLTFEVYPESGFFTREHWWSEHDGENLHELAHTTIEISISDIGILDEFIGRKFHFYVPNQYDIYHYDPIHRFEGGKQQTLLVTMPERIKIVLNDWGVDYRTDLLDLAIKESEEYIEAKIKEKEAAKK